MAGGAFSSTRRRVSRTVPAGARRGRVLLPSLILVATLASAPFGGLRATEAQPPAALKAGEVIATGPFDVTLGKVVTLDELSVNDLALPPASPGGRLMAIELTVTNTTDEPLSPLRITDAIGGPRAAVEPWPGQDEPHGELVAVADGTRVRTVNPGLSVHAVLVYPQPASWTADRIDLDVYDFRFQEEDPLSLDPDTWLLHSVVASGEFPIKESA
ncbi:MAG TPA: hypothetical protein P5314_15415 [Tetrasphaera sp.]|nr:hypothetical protein [Tetrasphaera sp.]